MKLRIFVTLKENVLDPQGQAVQHALKELDFKQAGLVRQGKVFDIVLHTDDREEAKKLAQDMCEQLLANTMIEEYQIEIVGS